MAETTTKTPAKKAAAKPAAATKPAIKKPVAAKKPAAAKPAAAVKVVTSAPPAAAKPAAKKPAAPKPAATQKTPAKSMLISGEQRYRMVAEAAYYRAESNQFKSDPLRDWIEAENDIAALLSGKK